ncbi:MAG: UDP-N-acetylmuramate--L-alanine ligase, partial [Saprospiraceae bacterium]|nr:UDP-N-acetylmuramate--L-alanine ligase [Saprospiraceae bacterium]
VYIDDYAHHPTELKAAINAARELFPEKNLVGVFQPHLYSRTRDFVEGFAQELDALDQVFLLDIYPAREEPIPGVTADSILKNMKNKQVIRTDLNGIKDYLRKMNKGVLMTLGAGDIDTLVKPMKEFFEARK